MDYKQEITRLREELKEVDKSHLGNSNREQHRKVVLLNAYEEIKRIDDIQQQEEDAENEDHEREQNENYREPLSVEKEEVYKILLSWGGW